MDKQKNKRNFYIIVVSLILLLIGAMIISSSKPENQKPTTDDSRDNYSNYKTTSINSDSIRKIEKRNRKQQKEELADKYERIIKRYHRDPLKTISVLSEEGFITTKSVQSYGNIMYEYTKTIDGFVIRAGLNDSPNPKFNEVVFLGIEDTEK